jgi:hypothetical protein
MSGQWGLRDCFSSFHDVDVDDFCARFLGIDVMA